MDPNIAYIIGAIVAVAIFLFIAKRVLRLAIKLVLVGIVILALLAGAGYGWWNGWFDTRSKPAPRTGPAQTASPR